MLYVLRFALLVLYTIFWGGLATLVGLVDRTGEAVCWIARRWMLWILATCRIRVEADGLAEFDPGPACVWMANHQSHFDVAAIVATIPVSWRFVAKRELVRIPLFGWAVWLGGNVIIDRTDREASVHSLARAAERVARGTHVIIFPEGTRSEGGELGAFKSGGFHLAIAAQVPIVPVTVSGSRQITPKGSLRIESGRIRVRYGTPIPTRGLCADDRHRLKEQVREAILAGYDPELEQLRRGPAHRAARPGAAHTSSA